jgi:hypothetical protein
VGNEKYIEPKAIWMKYLTSRQCLGDLIVYERKQKWNLAEKNRIVSAELRIDLFL